MDPFKKYKESVRPPISIRIALSFFVGFVFLGGLTWMMYPNTNRLPALVPSLIFVLAVGSVAFLLLSLFYKISIRVSKKFMANSAEKEILLRISGVKSEGGSYILCKNIKALEIRPYTASALAGITPFYSGKGDGDEQIIPLPGFKGEGILLTYTYETYFSQKKKTNTILFPTNDARYLFQFLKRVINAETTS